MKQSLVKPFIFASLIALPALSADIISIGSMDSIENVDLAISTSLSNLEGQLDKSTTFSSKLMLDSSIRLIEYFSLNSSIGMKFETGSSTSTFNERRNSPKSQLSYNHAYISYDKYDIFQVHAGALDNSNLESTSRFTSYNTSFLGVREDLTFGNDQHSIKVSLNQAIPSNDQLSQRIGLIDEGTPKYYSEMVTLISSISNFTFDLQAGHYAYEQLPSSVAFNDKYYGNSITGTTETNSAYAFNFKGWTYAGVIQFKLQDLVLSSSYETVINNESISGFDRGEAISLSIQKDMLSHTVQGSVTKFKNESDTAPSFYNNSYFKNNYEGFATTVEISNTSGFEASFNYIDRKVIRPSLYLANEKVIQISLRKTYDIF